MAQINLLLIQIARAKRLAATVTDIEERQKFESMAAEFQRQLDSLQTRPILLKVR